LHAEAFDAQYSIEGWAISIVVAQARFLLRKRVNVCQDIF
jgi:hypothetical protein